MLITSLGVGTLVAEDDLGAVEVVVGLGEEEGEGGGFEEVVGSDVEVVDEDSVVVGVAEDADAEVVDDAEVVEVEVVRETGAGR